MTCSTSLSTLTVDTEQSPEASQASAKYKASLLTAFRKWVSMGGGPCFTGEQWGTIKVTCCVSSISRAKTSSQLVSLKKVESGDRIDQPALLHNTILFACSLTCYQRKRQSFQRVTEKQQGAEQVGQVHTAGFWGVISRINLLRTENTLHCSLKSHLSSRSRHSIMAERGPWRLCLSFS